MASLMRCACRGVVVLSIAACGGDATDRPSPPTVRDSGGIAMVEVDAADLTRLPVWRLDSNVLVIGSADAAPEYLFHMAGMPWMLSDGDVIVPNAQMELRWYDSTGRHVRTIGRKGQGPGEFGQLWNVFPVEGDTILTTDAARRRVSVFDSSGTFVRSYPHADAQYPIGLNWLGNRHLVFARQTRLRARLAAGDTGVFLDTLVLMVTGPDTLQRDTLGYAKGSWTYVPRPGSWAGVLLAGSPLLATGAGMVVVAHGDELTLHWFDPARGPVRITRVSATPEPVPQRMMDSVQAWVAGGRGESGERPRAAYAKHLPVLTRVAIDRVGRTWARRWAPPAGEAEWIVFDTAGTPLARAMMPAGLTFSDAGEEYVLGRHTDADDVQTIRRYRLAR